jgi:phosphonate transport system substrate-binding protein
MPVELVVSPDYAELVKRFKNAELDFAFFSPLNFVEAERTAGAKVLLKKVYDTSEFYWSAIIVRNDSSVKKVSDLKGKKFGYVDPKSASGYLYALHLLQAGGVTKDEVQGEFLGTHDGALAALIDKKVDAAAVWGDGPDAGTGAWNLLAKTRPEAADVRVLVWSDPIPNDAFAVRAAFYEQQPMVSFKVMEALIGMSDDGDKVLKKVFNTERMATATSRHYDTVRALEKVLAQ